MSESFLDYRKRMEKIELYRAWEVENKKTFYRPQSHEAKVTGVHFDTPVDATFRMNIRRCDIPPGDED